MKGSSNPRGVSENEQIDWELRPGGMLVQERDDGGGASGPMIKIKVSHGFYQHDISVPAQATFGDLKRILAQETGLEPQEQRGSCSEGNRRTMKSACTWWESKTCQR